jgi:nicotinate phosphoribosyltransferase
VLTDFAAKKISVRIFENGRLVYAPPTLRGIRTYCGEQIGSLWDEVKRFENPHRYFVDLSRPLWDLKQHLLQSNQ